MLRIANPGSDIDSYVRIFSAIVGRFANVVAFSLDEMTDALIDGNLVSSCGHVGDKALALSTRADRSRDPLYNQSKMYSELFRVLGWISPQPDNRLRFSVTFLGRHVPECRDPGEIVKASLLGIAYPNESLDTKESVVLRPFKVILTTMLHCDGLLCRDEMIVGPLSLANDRSASAVRAMHEMVRRTRSSTDATSELESRLDALSERRGIGRVTMENYTRFPIGVLEWSGWIEKERIKGVYARPTVFLRLTDAGKSLARELDAAFDLRAADMTGLNPDTRRAAITVTGYRMLERSGFDVSPASEKIRVAETAVLGVKSLQRLLEPSALFSPFQELAAVEFSNCFPDTRVIVQAPSRVTVRPAELSLSSPAISSTLQPQQANDHGNGAPPAQSHTVDRLKSLHQRLRGNVTEAAQEFCDSVAGDAQRTFYPLVAELLSASGHRCTASRAGVNYQRFDALIEYPNETIPVEIKSPAEELHLSVKAVRQAAENKIVLRSRRNYPVTPQSCSIAVGFLLPTDRSEVSGLISDIHEAFGIRVAVLDLATLVQIAIKSICEGRTISPQALASSHGIIHVHS